MTRESAATPWPAGCAGAVSLTFDDGMPSQLALAIPLLDEHELRATFYVNPRGDAWLAWLEPWRNAAVAGHEIGNHSLTHPCSSSFDFTAPDRGLESLTLADVEADVLEAERRLREAIPEQPRRSFGYPCYLDYVGQGPTRQSYVPVIARHFVAARGKGEIPNHPVRSDLHHLWSFPVERMSGAELIGLAERAAATGRWSILTFHGISQGHLSVAETDLRELCAFLARQRGRIWTAPVATVAERLIEYRAAVGALP
jgi:peptidoglycan/xylan/chitin deacetylase (PgdA/CDA1 family)